MEASVRAAVLANILDTASECGLDPNALLRRHDLDARLVSDFENRVPLRKLALLFEDAAALSGVEEFALRAAERRTFASLGFLTLMLAHTPTLRETFAHLLSYRRFCNDGLMVVVEDCDDLVIVRLELFLNAELVVPQTCAYGLALYVQTIRRILGPQWQPLEVHIAAARPSDRAIYRRILGDALVFDSDTYRIVCAKADFDRPNPAADPTMVRHVKQLLDTLPLAREQQHAVDAARAAIYSALDAGGVSLNQVAARVGMHPRALQRALQREGVSLSELVDEVRRNLVMRYVHDRRYSMHQISEMLGFSRSSSFTHWFVSQFGCPASAYRNRGGTGAERRWAPARPSAAPRELH